MSLFPHGIYWSPAHKNQFMIKWKQKLLLFSIEDSIDGFGNRTDVFIVGNKHRFALAISGIWENVVDPHCFAWCPNLDEEATSASDHLGAVNVSGGSVRLFLFHGKESDSGMSNLHNKELISRPQRTIHLSWNPWKTSLLAQVVNKSLSPRDPSIFIWDIYKPMDSHTATQQNDELISIAQNAHQPKKIIQLYPIHLRSKTRVLPSVSCNRPVCVMGIQDIVVSFAWLSKSTLVAGTAETSATSATYLKLFDISDETKPCRKIPTKAVYGLTVDPFCNTRIASYFDFNVYIWRLDNMDKPVYTFVETSDVLDVSWSPLKEAWLGVLSEASTTLKLYDAYPMYLQQQEDSEQIPLGRVVPPSNRSGIPLVAFSWHPIAENCLFTLDQDGQLDVAEIIDRMALSWSPEHALLWSNEGQWYSYGLFGFKSSCLSTNADTSCESEFKVEQPQERLQISTELSNHMTNDISYIMQRRAQIGYGLKTDISSYCSLPDADVQLTRMWNWIKYYQEYLSEAPVRPLTSDSDASMPHRSNTPKLRGMSRSPHVVVRFLGALSILSGESSSTGVMTPSEVISMPIWEGLDAHLPFPRYKSPERSQVLRLCMWRLNEPDDVQRRMLDSLCSEGEFGRAATMALFNLKFSWALGYLNRAATASHNNKNTDLDKGSAIKILPSQEIGLVALALTGYTATNNLLWQETCSNLLNQIKNPYLKAMFTFLTRQGDDFDLILNNEGLRLNDRLAFACLYSKDSDLLRYTRFLCDRMVHMGRLEAVLLTGLASPDFITLLQQYINLTNDVQTAVVVSLWACQMHTNFEKRRSDSVQMRTAITLEGKTNRPISNKTSAGNVGGIRGSTYVPKLMQIGGDNLMTWVQCYRDLLDCWRMWFARAEFDTANKDLLLTDYVTSPGISSMAKSSQPSKNAEDAVEMRSLSVIPVNRVRSRTMMVNLNQIFVACGFCGCRVSSHRRQKLSTSILSPSTQASNTQMHEGGGKHNICQRCRKPLPRCAICLMHMGTVAIPLTDSSFMGPVDTREDALRKSAMSIKPILSENTIRAIRLSIMGTIPSSDNTQLDADSTRQSDSQSHGEPPNALSNLFIWCQACRHGGHASHVVDWFYGSTDASGPITQPVCPVSGCQCRCAFLDSLRPVPSPHRMITTPSKAPPPSDTRTAKETGDDAEVLSAVESGDDETVPLGLDDIVFQESYSSQVAAR